MIKLLAIGVMVLLIVLNLSVPARELVESIASMDSKSGSQLGTRCMLSAIPYWRTSRH